MNYKTIAPIAVATALLLGAACSDDGEDDAIVQSQPPSDDGSATSSGDGQTPTTEATGGGGDSSGGNDSSSGGTPQDQNLDIEMRNPLGVTLRVTRLSFDEDAIYVDAEVINSSDEDITFHPGNGLSSALRLVDDGGSTYHFVEPDGQEGATIDVAQGETVNGTFAFRGPLSGEPEQLSLVTNIYDEDIANFDLNDEASTWLYEPSFVVPLDLVWD